MIEDLELQLDEVFQKRVRTLCGLFVTIVENKIMLLHQTASEFLIALDRAYHYDGRSIPQPDKWQHSLPPRISHGLYAQTCTSILMFDTFRGGSPNFRDQGYDYEGLRRPSFGKCLVQRAICLDLNDTVFLEYAQRNWIKYLAASGEMNAITLEDIKVAVIDNEIDVVQSQLSRNIVDGESLRPLSHSGSLTSGYYVISGGHGTMMAKLMRRLYPKVRLYCGGV